MMNSRKGTLPLLKELHKSGRRGPQVPVSGLEDRPVSDILPKEFLREEPLSMPELSEVEVVRHFVNLSNLNYGVDNGFYPLGSCTMKYNPKINEEVAAWFQDIHPALPENRVQSLLELLYILQQDLLEITGMDAITLQPAAGAHGELTSLLMAKAYFKDHGLLEKDTVIIPDSAHGTNPASATMAGFKVITVKSDEEGLVDLEQLKTLVNDHTAVFMLTNPCGWAYVLRWRKSKRHAGLGKTRGYGIRLCSLESAQNLQHTPWWRRSWFWSGGSQKSSGAVFAEACFGKSRRWKW